MSAEHTIQARISLQEQKRLARERQKQAAEQAKLTAKREQLRLQQLRQQKIRLEQERRRQEAEREQLRLQQLRRQEQERKERAELTTKREQLRSHQLKASEVQAGLSELQQQADDLQKQTSQLNQQIQQCEGRVQHARQDLQAKITEMQSLQGEVNQSEQSLQLTIKQGIETLDQIDLAINATEQQVEYLGSAYKEGQNINHDIRQVDEDIQQISSELSFISHHQSIQPMAMLALQGMKENNYQLREVRSRGEYIAYFEHAEKKHQIAVRMEPTRQLHSEDSWDILMETFGMEDEVCLDELDDFTTSIEEIDGVDIKRGQFTYPKGARGGQLPVPSLQNTYRSDQKHRNRQQN